MDDNALKTFNSTLQTLRLEGDEDTPLVISTAGAFSSKPATAIRVNSDGDNSRTNAVQIQMCGGSTDNDTFSWKLYAWRQGNGTATVICDGTAALGTMQVVEYPNEVGTGAGQGRGDTATSKFWADTIVIGGNHFVKEWSVTDSGNNRSAILSGDLCGFNYLYLEVTEADGSTPQAGDVSAFFAGW